MIGLWSRAHAAMYAGIIHNGDVFLLEECEICGQSTGKLYTCKVCGKMFCRYCGSFTEKLCIDCVTSGEDEKPPMDEAKPSKTHVTK